MTFALFKIIYSIFAVLISAFYFIMLRIYPNSNKNLFDKRRGIVCSKCNEVLVEDDDLTMEIIERENYLDSCLSCKRDYVLNRLLSFKGYKESFDRWVLSKRSEKIMLISIIVPIPFIIASIFVPNTSFSSSVSIFNSTMLFIYWSVMIYRVYLCRKK